MTYARHAAALARQIEHAPFLDRLRALDPAGFDADMVTPVVDEAARFAEAVIAPVDAVLDRGGCRLVDGRVVTSDAHRAAWAAFVAAGWPTLNVAAAFGGQGLPLLFQTACEELFNRASPAFTMLPTPGRTAVAMLAPFAGADMVAEWLPRLATGEWAATICISEPDAGSDVGRIRTRATLDDGAWRVSGEKCWISYGDHDLSPRIGHCLIARTGTAAGVRGLSLFLVPSVRADRSRNAVFVRRIEEKMGLHGSPTCVLGFEAADAVLIGQEGRGLQQMFTMMLRMRLSTGAQGIGVAAGAAESALAYARDRRQGGDADAPPVAIAEHVDVRRQLLSMAARVETGRGLTLAAAAALDLAERETDPAAAAAAGVLAQWLLPIVKDLGARTGFDVASDAIQTFGGAGYTR
ncbi:MAG: acyl-CoA dehydrogenase family protein, partial [Janthinobacterium lividum]